LESQELSDEALASLDRSDAQIARITDSLSANAHAIQSSLFHALSGAFTSESRTPQKYKEEVANYREEYRKYLVCSTLVNYSQLKDARVIASVENKVDRTLEDVQVIVRFNGDVVVLGTDELRAPAKPDLPRKYGPKPNESLRASANWYGKAAMVAGLRARSPMVSRGPVIEYGEACSVTFPTVSLRAQEPPFDLPPIVVLVKREHEGDVTGTLEATAKNADGRIRQPFALKVSNDAATFPALIRDVLSTERSGSEGATGV
jgi:hypothetical protein